MACDPPAPSHRWVASWPLMLAAVVYFSTLAGLPAGVVAKTTPPETAFPAQSTASPPTTTVPAVVRRIKPAKAAVDGGHGHHPARSHASPPVTDQARKRGRALPPWQRHAVPVSIRPGQPVVAIVIDDLGWDAGRTARVTRLKQPLTLSFLPGSNRNLKDQTAAAHAAGHELLLHMPMESKWRAANPGPGALQAGLEPEENLRRLRSGLDAFSGYVGVNNHMGSLFTARRDLMMPVLTELKARGLLFLDSRTSDASISDTLAGELGLPHGARDVFLDASLDPAAIRAALAEVEKIARRRGAAVAIGHPHEATLTELEPWLRSLSRRGLTLVPISAIARRNQDKR